MNNLLLKKDLSGEQLSMVQSEYAKKEKNKTTMYLLWFFFGGFGIHRFYLGDTGRGVAMLLLNWATLGIWALIDVFLIGSRLEQLNNAAESEAIQNVKALSK